jgi:uncharacterized protein (TIGR02646 family)
MIRYTKGAPPVRLTSLAATPGVTWAGLGAGDRDPIRAALVRDQGGLCAYCQRRITIDEDPVTRLSLMKIEHWIPRATSPEHHLTWSNLLGVCMGASQESADARPGQHAHHCDASRGDRILFLNPVDGQGPDPRAHLRYTKGGEVKAEAGHARVDDDIRALNLNAWRLRRARETVFDELWKRLERSGFATGELRRVARLYRIVAGTTVPEHAEFVRYHVLKKLRSRAETE